jgi:capsule polysaccharide export protein KpsE/RkpR
VLSTLVALLIPNRYEATTQLMPPDSQSGNGLAMISALMGAGRGATGGGLTSLAGDVMGLKSSGALFMGVIKSRTVQDRLIQQFDLGHVYHASKMEDIREALANRTDVSEDRKSGIIKLTVTDRDPKRAAAMAQAYVNELDRLVAQVSTSSARRERVFLEERLNTVKQELGSAEHNFSDFASKNTAIDIPAQAKAMVEAAARLQGELMVAESGLRGLEAIYTDQNVRVRAMRARVNELQDQLQKLGGDGSTSAGSQPGDSNPMYPSIRKLPVLGVTYADLYRQAKIQETVYELLTQQYELAKVQEAKEIPSVKVLDVATVPTKKSFPHRGLLILAGILSAMVCTCLFLIGKEQWENTESDSGKQLVQEVMDTTRREIVRHIPEDSRLRRWIPGQDIRREEDINSGDTTAAEKPNDPTERSRVARNSP